MSEAKCETWQPIATAPKDGTRIICFWPNYGRHRPVVGEACWMAPSHLFMPHFCHAGNWTPADPSHWMPLPTPPKDTGHE